MTAALHVVESGEGTPLLWIHGFPLSAHLFQRQLGIAGVRHLMPDLPGFGSTPHRPWESLDEAATLLATELERRGIERCMVAGVSMGGYVALAMTRLYPETVSGLILMDTRETADTDEARARRLQQAARIELEGIGFVVADMLPKMFTPATMETDEALVDETRAMMLNTSAPGAISALKAMAARSDSSEVLRSFRGAVLVLAGEADTITPPSDAERMHALAADARLVIVPQASHLAVLERPDECNVAIAAFVEGARGK